MSNYIVFQNGKRGNKFLLNEDLSSITFPIPKEEMDDMLKKELEKDLIWCFQFFNQYVLYDAHIIFAEVTAPLYVFNGTEKLILKSEAYTGLCIIPLDYETAKTKFSTCKENIAKRKLSYYNSIYDGHTLDCGISATFHLNDIYEFYYLTDDDEKYIPKEYIKVYEKRTNLNCRLVLFIKKRDANGEVVKIKVEDQIKKAILDDNGKNLERVAK